MADTLSDALQNYLNGPEWRQSIETFVEANCMKFDGVVDYDHEHHRLWMDFKEIVEAILDMALGEVGGSIESLEKMFDEISHTRATGPKDGTIKDILGQLMTYDSFEMFSHMMRLAAENMEDTHRGSEPPVETPERFFDSLINMGFPEPAVH